MEQVRGRSRRARKRYRRKACLGDADRRGDRPEASRCENAWGVGGQSTGPWSEASRSDPRPLPGDAPRLTQHDAIPDGDLHSLVGEGLGDVRPVNREPYREYPEAYGRAEWESDLDRQLQREHLETHGWEQW
jgi:hypothetical protein